MGAEPLTIVPPLDITDARLIATDVAENDYPEWSGTSTYGLGERVIVTDDHAIYESLASSNSGNLPSASANHWIKVSATNRWKLFDYKSSSKTVASGSMSYTVNPAGSVVNAVCLLGVVAESVQIILTDSVDGEVYNKTYSMAGLISEPTWHAWFFEDIYPIDRRVILDLPNYSTADIQIILSDSNGDDVSISTLLMGYQRRFGLGVNLGATVGILDYSRKEADEFGEYTFVERAYSGRFEFDMAIKNNSSEALNKQLIKYRSSPVVWIGNPGRESTILLGFYTNYEVNISYPEHDEISIDVEGLT